MRQVSWGEIDSQWPILDPLDGSRQRPIALNKRVCIAGDRVHVNLALPAETVSRAHAMFVTDASGLYLRDLASLNQVFVNGEPVRETSLRVGDVIRIGPYAFRCDGAFASSKNPDGQDNSHAPAGELRTPDDELHVPLASRRTTLLGSRDDCDIKMPGDTVSPAHAVIFELDQRRYIRDLRSIGGTFVNDRKVGQVELTPGDQIRVGDSTLVYEAAPAHDPDATLAGILAEDQAESDLAPLKDEKAAAPDASLAAAASPLPAPPPDDLDMIPLLDEFTDSSGEFRSIAREFAEEKDGATTSPTKAVADFSTGAVDSSPEDSGIIPLAHDSAFDQQPPIKAAATAKLSQSGVAIPLADDPDVPVTAQDSSRFRPGPRRRDAAEPRKQKPRKVDQSASFRQTRKSAPA